MNLTLSFEMIKQLSTLILFLLIFIQISYVAGAVEQVGISLDCFDSCKDKNNIDYSEDIIFVLTIKNNLNFWIAIEGGSVGTAMRVDVENIKLPNNGKGYDVYSNLLGQSYFIKPKDEVKVYIPFNLYNKISKDDRLGNWKINPELSFYNAKFYNIPFESKEIPLIDNMNRQPFTVNSPIKGNILEFKVIKPEVEVQTENSNIKIPNGLLGSISNNIIEIIVGVSIIVLGGLILNQLSRKTKSKRK